MKFHLAFVVAVIGVGMVAADENLTPVKATKDLEIEARDSEERCLRDTDDCDGHGVCQLSTFGRNERYICLCALGYRNNNYGGCSPYTPREIEFLSYAARDLKLEMLTRDSLGRCIADTQDCDGAGECKTKTTGRYRGEYICVCDDGYRNNNYGGCSLIVTRATEVDDDDFTERKKEIMQQLVEFLQEE